MNTTVGTTISGSNGSNDQAVPLLIPITFQPQQQQLSVAPTDIDTTNNNYSKLQLQEWAMIEINGELLLPPLSSSSTSSSTTTTTSSNDGTTSSTSITTIFDTRKNIELGSISFETSHNTTNTKQQLQQPVPIMIIGTHELRGTIIELQQPFLCLEKNTKHDDRTIDRNTKNDGIVHMIERDDEGNDDRANTISITTEYFIRGIIKYKFIFNQYPKTIMR